MASSDQRSTGPGTADQHETAPAQADRPGATPARTDRPETAPTQADGSGTAPAPADRPGTTPTAADRPGTTPTQADPGQFTQAQTAQGQGTQAQTAQARADQSQTASSHAGSPFAPTGAQSPIGSQPTGPGSATAPDEDDFVPANEVERDLYHAVDEGSTDSYLSTLLLATVLVPVAHNSRPGSAPGESGFVFRTEEIEGDRFLVVFTSRDRLAEHFAEPTRTVGVRFVDLIRNWPDPAWSFAVNPTSPIGARYPGPQVIALASWAVEAGLGGDPVEAPAALPQQAVEPAAHLTVMQKAVPAEQIDYYLERGYDRVAGFVHRAGEVEHLRTPGDLFSALGLLYDGSPYQADAKEAFVLRWPAHRPSLYRIPYGGQSEQALRAMDGWVIERPPFRGNGFAPGEGKDVIAEFKVDSVRLPHGAQLWRIADDAEQLIAVFDCDAPVWRRVGER
ncbi:SseB family protein [Actinoplanes auranticolor]|uniref:SseB family protein n=1 Tax=Actinoplanes auranticolor TaxID=47988 RepID=UPI001FE3E26A|nr:SseB family protein [Actinoplanes auranticolor]